MLESRRLILRPLVTERSVANTAHSQYAFQVDQRASKQSIRSAVEQIFKVKVLRVNTVALPKFVPKNLRKPVRHRVSVRGTWKKAIVTLRPGDKIELGGVNYFES